MKSLSDFRPGDRVIAVCDSFLFDEYRQGTIGIVRKIKDGGLVIAIESGETIKSRLGTDLICSPDNWEMTGGDA